MPRFGQRRYHRAIGAGVGAAAAAARSGYYMAKRALSRLKKRWNRRKSRGGVVRRLSRRHNRKFLRSMNMTPNRVCTLVYRGSVIRNGPSNGNLAQLCYFDMCDARDPGASEPSNDTNLTALWGKTATGFNHMATMYRKCRTLGSVGYFSVRASKVFNVQATSSGTSTYGAGINAVPLKVGVLMTQGHSLSDFGSWDEAALRDDPIKTFKYRFDAPLNSCHFVVKFSPRKFFGSGPQTVATDVSLSDQWYSLKYSPSGNANAIIWMQTADKVSIPTIIAWEVSWCIKYRVLFVDFEQSEADMAQQDLTVPS